jgi:nitrite reductase/ring-hydroxylating ferredoxin subunit
MPDTRPLRDNPEWIDAARGLVSRDVFVSDEIYRLELLRIFDRQWVFLAHESELPEAGDYVVRQLGSARVIVIRDGEVRAFLNTCRHRGPALCRTDQGQVRNFVCPYHGWSYRRDGSLITTGFDRHFPDGTDLSALGLIPVPRLESYKGLVFGCWDPDIVPLEQYLGDFRWYLNAFFARSPGGMQVLAPPHRWRAKANWKFGALNFIGDSQHVLTTHIGPTTLDPLRKADAGLFAPGKESVQLITDEGHGCTLTYLKEDLPEKYYQTHPPELDPLYDAMLAPKQRAMIRGLRVAVGNVFPNFSFIESSVGIGAKAIIIRLWQPVGGTEMEILSWVLAEREASEAYKETALKVGFRMFGIAGVFEQDDLAIWTSSAAASDNSIARHHPYSFQTSLRYRDSPLADYQYPGRAWRPIDTEVVQFEFMRHWERVMRSNL